jgi:hypothetical protein
MSWIALLLVGIGVTDLVFSALPPIRRLRHVPEAIGATTLILLGLLAELTAARDLGVLLVLGAIVLAWGETVTRGFASGGRAWWPLAVLAGGLFATIALSPFAGTADGIVGEWLERTPLDVLARLDADEALALLGVMLVQLSTGNVVVRLVLSATGTVNPARVHGRDLPTYRLKGGRLLGPMERVFIVGLGVAGELTAASVVVAAKGLLRWPELQAARDQGARGPGIHAVTEYFLVGSFVSWMLALGSLVLLA